MWLDSLRIDRTMHVIGAGISGLLAGHYLKKAGLEFKIWEISNKTGGKIQSYYTEFGLVETAANAIILDQNVSALLNDLNLTPLPARKKLTRWVADKNKWHGHISIMLCFFINLLLKGFKTAHIKEQNQITNLKKFFSPLIGEKWSLQFLSAISRGIFAQNSPELSLDAFFQPTLLSSIEDKKINYFQFFFSFLKYKKKNKTHGSISFHHGLQELITALTVELKDHLQLNTSIDTIQEKINLKNTLFCNNPLKEIPVTGVQSITLFTNTPFKKLEKSFGVLLTPDNVQPFLGILAQSEIFSHRTINPHHHCYTLIGYIVDVELVLNAFCKFAELKRENILEFVQHPWPASIPIYNNERHKVIQQIKQELAKNSNQMFFGNYISSIGIKDLIAGAKNMVDSILTKS